MEEGKDRKPSVFVSASHQLAKSQSYFVEAIEEQIRSSGMRPTTIGRIMESPVQPLNDISMAIQESLGTIVIAFPRLHVIQAIEHPFTDLATNVGQQRYYPTVWNQIEAAMTLQAGHPLLILAQEGLFPEGILDPEVFPIHTFPIQTNKADLPEEVYHILGQWLKSIKP
jgi:hypothetical protein